MKNGFADSHLPVVDVEPFDERADAYGALGERKLEHFYVLFPTERTIEEEFDWTDVDAVTYAFVLDVERLDGFDWEVNPSPVAVVPVV